MVKTSLRTREAGRQFAVLARLGKAGPFQCEPNASATLTTLTNAVTTTHATSQLYAEFTSIQPRTIASALADNDEANDSSRHYLL
ncbi:hypothetical protein NM688_g8568 [Phlebia brevispora]|uniref:Uncharacterized protein n=1 Tax=Phlebia brevispora TaxID=194682 RepID=A0ACC1RRH7_9APHY|nr:hypothetical protein NM688_g8568 [Phlebia brevispora]